MATEKVKGLTPNYIVVDGHWLDVKYLTPFYKLLWVKYLNQNPELVRCASEFDDFNDMFKGYSVNCQADVIRQYVKEGRDSIMKESLVQEFIAILKRK